MKSLNKNKVLATTEPTTPMKTNRRPLYLKSQSVPRCKHFSSGL